MLNFRFCCRSESYINSHVCCSLRSQNYFSVHFDDATLASQCLLKVSVKTIQGIPSAWIGQSNYETFLKELLLVKAYRVEIYAEVRIAVA